MKTKGEQIFEKIYPNSGTWEDWESNLSEDDLERAYNLGQEKLRNKIKEYYSDIGDSMDRQGEYITDALEHILKKEV